MVFAFSELNQALLVFKFAFNFLKLEKQVTQVQINVINHFAL